MAISSCVWNSYPRGSLLPQDRTMSHADSLNFTLLMIIIIMI